MKAYFLGAKAGKPVLELRDVATPEPKPGEILIKVKAASLNRGELISGFGLMEPLADSAPKPIGIDAAGEVAATGAGVTGWKPGTRFMGRAKHSFAEYAIADAREAMAVPDTLSWEEAAAVPIAFLTAYDMLVDNGDLKPGEWVLVTGISSGVGVACLQIAKALGAKVIGTSGSPAKLAALQKLGLDHGITTRGGVKPEEMRKLTGGQGVDIVINNVGGTVFESCLASMAYKGRLATVGYVDGSLTSRIDLEILHRNRLVLFGVSNKHRTMNERAVSTGNFIHDILPHFASGRIKPLVDKVFPFDDLQGAQRHMLANDAVGKIILRMP